MWFAKTSGCVDDLTDKYTVQRDSTDDCLKGACDLILTTSDSC